MDESNDQILKFDGTEVEVTKDLRLCMAAGECNRAACMRDCPSTTRV